MGTAEGAEVSEPASNGCDNQPWMQHEMLGARACLTPQANCMDLCLTYQPWLQGIINQDVITIKFEAVLVLGDYSLHS